MTIVTLTTDLGRRDYYAGLIKGGLLSTGVALNIIDITHHIKTYDIVEASFVLGNVYQSFPKGSIHIVSVNNFDEGEKQFITMEHEGHFFIGPDNGIFTLMFEEMPKKIYAIPSKDKSTFPLTEIFAQAVAHISSEAPFKEIGKLVKKPVQRITLQAVISKSQIRGSVIHIDNYDNVILNIKKDLFLRMQAGRSFSLFFKRHDPIKSLSEQYSDVPVGDTLCLFNSADYLEIAINLGKAASLLGLAVDDTVQIDFHD